LFVLLHLERLGMRIVELIRWTRHIEPPLALV
jgi:hypothetical protein